MRYKILLDKKKRFLFKKNELKRTSIKISNRLNAKLKISNFIKLFDISVNTSLNRIKNRCFITGRSKSIYKKFKVSRIKLREMIVNSNYPGFTKYSW